MEISRLAHLVIIHYRTGYFIVITTNNVRRYMHVYTSKITCNYAAKTQKQYEVDVIYIYLGRYIYTRVILGRYYSCIHDSCCSLNAYTTPAIIEQVFQSFYQNPIEALSLSFTFTLSYIFNARILHPLPLPENHCIRTNLLSNQTFYYYWTFTAAW